MKERPILFSAPMVCALLEGRKTQTRRIAKFTDAVEYPGMPGTQCVNLRGKTYWLNSQTNHPQHISKVCPYGQPGDRLWVRETWGMELISGVFCGDEICRDYEIRYRAGGELEFTYKGPHQETDPFIRYYDTQRGDWRPSIHMPRWASRILREIVSVRVERLQDISEADAKAEGIKGITKDGHTIKYGLPDHDGLPGNDDIGWPWGHWCLDARDAYQMLWDKINGAGEWDKNPWVWVVEFKHLDPGSAQ